MTTLPTLTDDDLAALEARELETALAIVNGGGTPNAHQRRLIIRAHERSKQTVTTELGLEVEEHSPTQSLEQELRGTYDVSRLEQRHPQLVNLVAELLAVPGIQWDWIAERAKLAWETVAAIAKSRAGSIREFKARNGAMIGVCLEAAGPVLLKRIREGKIDPLGYKLLQDAWLMLQGEATSRVEHVRKLTPEEEALRQFMSQVTFSGSGSGMGLVTQKTPAMAALPDPDNRVDGGFVALSTTLSVRELQAQEAVLLSNDPEMPQNFNQGGEGVTDAEPSQSS